jgi:hypothetical protein
VDFTHLDVAMAYATRSGVESIKDHVIGAVSDKWDALSKRWIVGIDWCRSDPDALDELAAQSGSSLRIPAGSRVVEEPACTPAVPFHPKVFVLSSTDAIGVVSGSGNLSRNGLTRGHEFGTLYIVERTGTPQAAEDWRSALVVRQWWDDLWRVSTPLSEIIEAYRARFESAENLRTPPAVDDDTAEVERLTTKRSPGGVTPVQLRQLRSARFFWIEAGKLSKNRGPRLPGNQLMMSRMTRVFFGMPAIDVPENTALGSVKLRYVSDVAGNYSMRFSDNSMDVLSLPIPGAGGPARYDFERLLFERLPHNEFVLSVLSSRGVARAKKASKQADTLYKMRGGREYGVY